MPFISAAGRRVAALLLAVALGSGAARGQGIPTNTRPPDATSPAPVFPKPAPANRARLSSALTKPTATSVADLKAIERQVKSLISRAAAAVVAVEISGGTGSGVLIAPDGLVLTAGHVAGRAGRDVRFRFANGRIARGQTRGSNSEQDTGLARITDPGPWPFAPVGELDSAVIGDWVLALGHPGGFDLERARVVRLGRIIRLAPGVLQTDCTISPGDSGGPLFDMQGRVIGIHSFISTAMVENFHVPITKFREDWAMLINARAASASKPSPAAYLGATGVDDPAGCRLEAIEPGSPAARAGLKAGDVVVSVEGRTILTAAMLQRWLSDSQPGETLALEIKRGSETLPFSVKLAAPRQARRPWSTP